MRVTVAPRDALQWRRESMGRGPSSLETALALQGRAATRETWPQSFTAMSLNRASMSVRPIRTAQCPHTPWLRSRCRKHAPGRQFCARSLLRCPAICEPPAPRQNLAPYLVSNGPRVKGALEGARGTSSRGQCLAVPGGRDKGLNGWVVWVWVWIGPFHLRCRVAVKRCVAALVASSDS